MDLLLCRVWSMGDEYEELGITLCALGNLEGAMSVWI